jgi:lipoprotein-anchoring transpeptidase ErfK/SrfK
LAEQEEKMQKSSLRFRGLLSFLMLWLCIVASVLLTACGGQATQTNQGSTNQGSIITQGVHNIDLVPGTPTTTAKKAMPDSSIPMATATPTTPAVITVSWISPSTLYTIGYANVRSTPYTTGTLIKTISPLQELTAYGTVNGDILSDGGVWYRVSDANSTPEYVYNDLVITNKPAPVNDDAGKVIKVNLTTQHAYAYDNGVLVHDNLITSGQPGLLTPTGTFQIISKLSPAIFYSPWPLSSPYYYAPLHINYALGFQGTLLFLHDAYWRNGDFGPGTNIPHMVNGKEMTGSHGCVEMSTADAAWYYNWATNGIPLIISY